MVKDPWRMVPLRLTWAALRLYTDHHHCSITAVRPMLSYTRWRSSPLSCHDTKHTILLPKSSSFPFCQEIQSADWLRPVTSTFDNTASYCKYTFHYFTARWSLDTILDTAVKTKRFYQTVPSLGPQQQSCCDGPEPRTSLCMHQIFTKRK